MDISRVAMMRVFGLTSYGVCIVIWSQVICDVLGPLGFMARKCSQQVDVKRSKENVAFSRRIIAGSLV